MQKEQDLRATETAMVETLERDIGIGYVLGICDVMVFDDS